MTLAVAAVACGSFGPPEACGEGIGGTADQAAFARHFTSLLLVHAATGQPGPEDPEGGPRVGASDQLALLSESLGELAVRACVQERAGGGQIVYNETTSLRAGAGSIPLGPFAPGSYVIRLIVDDTLVKNFPYVITE